LYEFLKYSDDGNKWLKYGAEVYSISEQHLNEIEQILINFNKLENRVAVKCDKILI